MPVIDDDLLNMRTAEDVYLLAWGTDQLTHRAEDLEKIERWTAREPDWNHLLRLHHTIRPKPKGKPTFHLVAQLPAWWKVDIVGEAILPLERLRF